MGRKASRTRQRERRTDMKHCEELLHLNPPEMCLKADLGSVPSDHSHERFCSDSFMLLFPAAMLEPCSLQPSLSGQFARICRRLPSDVQRLTGENNFSVPPCSRYILTNTQHFSLQLFCKLDLLLLACEADISLSASCALHLKDRFL